MARRCLITSSACPYIIFILYFTTYYSHFRICQVKLHPYTSLHKISSCGSTTLFETPSGFDLEAERGYHSAFFRLDAFTGAIAYRVIQKTLIRDVFCLAVGIVGNCTRRGVLSIHEPENTVALCVMLPFAGEIGWKSRD